ncbi:MAG TPA: hypothetical protein VGR24_08775 [bacterium]|jgi:hypothetical protein|nr:hypothetical protein [bacterium]
MDESKVVSEIRKVAGDAVDARRGLIGYSKMEAIEMDRRARAVEREALEKMKLLLPAMPALPALHQIRLRLQRMEERLEELTSRQGIAETSRTLESDDIVWRTFEDVLELLEA